MNIKNVSIWTILLFVVIIVLFVLAAMHQPGYGKVPSYNTYSTEQTSIECDIECKGTMDEALEEMDLW